MKEDLDYNQLDPKTNVLVRTFSSFLEKLKTRTFFELIRDHDPTIINREDLQQIGESISGDDGLVTKVKMTTKGSVFAYKTYWVRDRAKYGSRDKTTLDNSSTPGWYDANIIAESESTLLYQYYAQLIASIIYPEVCPSPSGLVTKDNRLVGHLIPWIESVTQRDERIPESVVADKNRIIEELRKRGIFAGNGELDVRYQKLEDRYRPFLFDLDIVSEN